MAITYECDSMAELADHLLGLADDRRKQGFHAVRKALQREYAAEARGIELAAGIVRDTTVRVPA